MLQPKFFAQARTCLLLVSLGALTATVGLGAEATPEASDTAAGDAMVDAYFRAETARLADRCLADVSTLEEWQDRQIVLRQQLLEMLGLDPLPEKTDLQATITGRLEHDEFTVEKLHFQSRPQLYVTANLYVPKGLDGPAPTILYVCGHGRVKKNGISYGNKTHYQHHAAWFARNGYVCLVIDTLQLGEIEGVHHGTYREGMWWWNAVGYTPAGVEAWNCVRALDYLESRPEVDRGRIGVTGRSGGGAYSWWIAAIDDRIKVAVPVAGITDLENHVVDDVIEGHCDCMFMVNTYGWDYATVAAPAAPRPLLISNSDKDSIFPLEGVLRIHQQVRRIYRLAGADDKLGLQITEGPHKDTQELRIHAFHWFNRFLKGEDPLIEQTAVPLFEVEELKVFDELPDDEINTKIHETFTVTASPSDAPESAEAWESQRDGWLENLRQKSFGGWPDDAGDLQIAETSSVEQDGLIFQAFEFTSQEPVRLPLLTLRREGDPAPELVVLHPLDEAAWARTLATLRVGFGDALGEGESTDADVQQFAALSRMLKGHAWAMAYFAPRGIGPTIWDQDERENLHIRRRFMLLGQTLDGQRVWDTRRAIQAVGLIEPMSQSSLWLEGEGVMGGIALYASLFESDVARLDLWNLPASHRDGPVFLNVMRILDMPQAVALAAERSQVRIYQSDPVGWEYPQSVADGLAWGAGQLQLRVVPQALQDAAGN